MINIEDFEKVDLRVGKIIDVENFTEAKKPTYKLKIDFGEFGVKSSSSRIVDLYTPDELLGKLVICVTNLPPKKIGPFKSEVLTTGFYREDGSVVLAIPEKEIQLGAKLG
jgi:tRNA-binding protein